MYENQTIHKPSSNWSSTGPQSDHPRTTVGPLSDHHRTITGPLEDHHHRTTVGSSVSSSQRFFNSTSLCVTNIHTRYHPLPSFRPILRLLRVPARSESRASSELGPESLRTRAQNHKFPLLCTQNMTHCSGPVHIWSGRPDGPRSAVPWSSRSTLGPLTIWPDSPGGWVHPRRCT